MNTLRIVINTEGNFLNHMWKILSTIQGGIVHNFLLPRNPFEIKGYSHF